MQSIVVGENTQQRRTKGAPIITNYIECVSQNLWQRRLSLVLAEWYTRDVTHHAAINALINNLQNDKEYYVKKAATWINRNFEKGG